MFSIQLILHQIFINLDTQSMMIISSNILHVVQGNAYSNTFLSNLNRTRQTYRQGIGELMLLCSVIDKILVVLKCIFLGIHCF